MNVIGKVSFINITNERLFIDICKRIVKILCRSKIENFIEIKTFKSISV